MLHIRPPPALPTLRVEDHLDVIRMDVIGHGNAVRFLTSLAERGAATHAYLFVGPRSVGKSTVAARFLERLVGLTADGDDPWAALRRSPDVMILEREEDPKTGKRRKNVSIEQVRGLRDRLGMSSFLSSMKVGIIPDADALSEEAANALLKTLEEPTKGTVIVLIAPAVSSVPATIASRCQVLRFALVPEGEIRDGLLARGAADDDAELLAARAAGRPGVALTLRTDGDRAIAEGRAAEEFVRHLGAPVWQRLTFAERVLPAKVQGGQADAALGVLGLWEEILRDALAIAAGQTALVRHRPYRDRIAHWAASKSTTAVRRALAATRESAIAIGENVNPRLALEHVLLST